MSLPYLKRTTSKSAIKKLRREGYIPAVIYGRHGKVGEAIAIPTSDYQTIARKIQPGHLPTTIFTIVDEKKHERRVIVKDIQYAIPSYDVAHIDFEELIDGIPLNVKVPIECVGMVDCIGIKLGGVLRQVIRHLKVRCVPKDIPSFFQFDIKDMGLFQSKRLSELEIPKGVKPLVDVNEVAIAIVKR